MIKSLAFVAVAGLSSPAFAGGSHHRAPADAASYYATYDGRTAAPAPAPVQRSDFGSFSTGATANNLGYTAR